MKNKLKFMEKSIFEEEIKKMENVEKSFKDYTLFNSLAIMFFIMSFIIIITACIYKALLININDTLISLVVLTFVVLSIISLIISTFYNRKTIVLAKQYYKN